MIDLFEQYDLEPPTPTLFDAPAPPGTMVPAAETVTAAEPNVSAGDTPEVLDTDSRADGPASRVELLPPDFRLSALTQFVPDVRLRLRVEALAAEALAIEVTGADGVARADAALENLRGAVKALEAPFAEPTSLAYRLHKRLTSLLGEWRAAPDAALKTVGDRVLKETQRLAREKAEADRQAQAEADRLAKASAQRQAELAARNGARPEVVETLKRRAETATAPPVRPADGAPPALRSSTVKKTWRARFAGTPAEAEPHPAVADLSDAQRLAFLKLCQAIVDGRAPIAAVKAIDWAYLDERAAHETTALAIPGIEVYEDAGLRAKPARRV